MNENDLDVISKLKELRDKNALTQEEFDEQVANYLKSSNQNSSSSNEPQQQSTKPTTQGGTNFLWLVILCIIGYIFIETKFPEMIECNASASVKQCNCVRQAVARNASFMDKVKIFITGASREELNSYLGVNGLACAFMGG